MRLWGLRKLMTPACIRGEIVIHRNFWRVSRWKIGLDRQWVCAQWLSALWRVTFLSGPQRPRITSTISFEQLAFETVIFIYMCTNITKSLNLNRKKNFVLWNSNLKLFFILHRLLSTSHRNNHWTLANDINHWENNILIRASAEKNVSTNNKKKMGWTGLIMCINKSRTYYLFA